uniref:tetratricopeptide repeat protein n=1 Tax=uncultured Erythrobacter sp. TaxID=263913 RepID=UPI002605D628|nr:tetratricopeptide repeat protein [uncultured Erythrobacter sp.]
MSLLLAILLQSAPGNTGAIPNLPDDLIHRPPRENSLEAPTNPTSAWLSQCLDQLAEDPARAHTQAQIRRTETSGSDRVIANHCLGLASTELGLWSDARGAFLAARDETPKGELTARARFGTMAGNAALAGGDAEGAAMLLMAAQQDAQSAASATLEALAATDRARALVALGQNEEALGALDTANRLEPGLPDGWLLKATLLRRMERLDEAQTAIERAADLAPVDPQIGLEAGVIAILSGREDAARKSWQSVVDTQPASPAATTAKDYLAQIGPAPDTKPTP